MIGYILQMFDYSTNQETMSQVSDNSILEESFIGNLNQSDSLKSVNSENDLEIKKKLLS